MVATRSLLLLLAVLVLAAFPASAAGGEEGWCRVAEEEGGALRLEVASRSFAPPAGKGPTVHLVSAVHVADAAFYADAQARLDGLDLVLFEGVKPAGAGAVDAAAGPEERSKATLRRFRLLAALADRHREEAGSFPADMAELAARAGRRWADLLPAILVDGWGRAIRYGRRAAADGPGGAPEAALFDSDGPDGRAGSPGDDLHHESPAKGKAAPPRPPGIQLEFARALGLTYQDDGIDCGKPRWRGSDMSLDEFERRMEAAGADASALLAFLDGTSVEGRMASFFLGMIAKSPPMVALVKMLMIETLGSEASEGSGGAGGLVKGNLEGAMRVIIEERNAVVLRDLRGVIAKEPRIGSVGVFYGAGHMKDMEARLIGDLGYRAEATRWTSAMRVDPRDAGLTAEQARGMRAMLRKSLEKRGEGR